MKTNKISRRLAERDEGKGWVLELAIFAMLAPAMIYDFLSLGTFAGL